jgi:hypothetical protein
MGPVIRLAYIAHRTPTFTSRRGTSCIKYGLRNASTDYFLGNVRANETTFHKKNQSVVGSVRCSSAYRTIFTHSSHRTSRSSGQHSSFVSGDPGFDSLPRRPAVLIEVFRGFPVSLQENARIVPQNKATTAFYQILSNSSFTYLIDDV